ncbi:Phosphoglycerate mutase [Pseudonocardia dioxanivorans CB1190]|uniref:Phosphoglycerate mutase n=1 Tax=Pseudonocardia dioxanivorans (strain ATCC 55486 / DSM 44775 / JCM 13855 / CB1190) TaxID=675635 RepID=F4CWX9_PSEUX|nr:histidine phosphatase family protein [Pseudonocardia dioxanivorans]AEA24234.1 Phosphoglycerate mutase [Pseudonocardia dioxanivorans CB1190]
MSLRRVVLLRHGQTDHNVDGRMQGHVDSTLTARGLGQARAVAPELARFAPARLISSDLSRAARTAAEVAAVTGLPVEYDVRLRETDLGDWGGMSIVDIERTTPGAIDAWRSDPTWRPPGGETRVEVVARSVPLVEELDAEYADTEADVTVLLVAHSGVIAGMVSGLLDLPQTVWPAVGGMGNAHWAVLGRRPGKSMWRLTGYNVGLDR